VTDCKIELWNAHFCCNGGSKDFSRGLLSDGYAHDEIFEIPRGQTVAKFPEEAPPASFSLTGGGGE